MRLTFSLISIGFIAVLSAQAQASHIDLSLGESANFNLVTRQNANLYDADSQGAIAVGGNAVVDHYDVGVTSNGGTVLHVEGDLSAKGSGNIKGDTVVKGNYTNDSSSQWHDPLSWGSELYKTSDLNIADAFAELALFSKALAELESNVSASAQYSILELQADRHNTYSDNMFVADITLDELNTYTGLKGSLFETDDFLVVNIASDNVVSLDSFDVLWGLPERSNILYNFINAEVITLKQGNIHGHILAPYADFTFEKGLITGGVYVDTFSSYTGAQLNFEGAFSGNVQVSEVSEPEHLALFFMSVVLLSVTRRTATKK